MTQVQSTSRSEAISSRHMAPSVIAEATSLADRSIAESQPARDLKAPHYLTANYWWAYVHPRAIWLFERQWLVNLILWGNYKRLRNAAMTELGDVLPGATLQVACVYGDLTGKLSRRVAAGGGRLDIVDVLPMQLRIAVFPAARTAQPASPADTERSLSRGQAGRPDRHCRLCASALVASASLSVAALAGRARAFRAGSVA